MIENMVIKKFVLLLQIINALYVNNDLVENNNVNRDKNKQNGNENQDMHMRKMLRR